MSTVLGFKLNDKLARVPQQATLGAACLDLQSISEGIIVPGKAMTFRIGLSFVVPEGHVMLIFSRSGMGFKQGGRLSNCVGVIDSDYRGEVMVRMHNDGENAIEVKMHDRIAQAMLVKLPEYDLAELSELPETDRGAKGFGSTGK